MSGRNHVGPAAQLKADCDKSRNDDNQKDGRQDPAANVGRPAGNGIDDLSRHLFEP